MDEVVDDFLVEAVNEATFASPRKWALVVVALIAGGGIALWLAARRRQGGDAADEPL